MIPARIIYDLRSKLESARCRGNRIGEALRILDKPELTKDDVENIGCILEETLESGVYDFNIEDGLEVVDYMYSLL